MFDRLFINADGIERIGAPARGLFHHRDKFLRSFRPGDEEEIPDTRLSEQISSTVFLPATGF